MRNYIHSAAIYKITNPANGKVYIGQAVHFIRRWNDHKKYHHRSNSILSGAFKKYGIDTFIFEVIECIIDLSVMDDRETFWIDYYHSHIREYGYNLLKIGRSSLGRIVSEEQKAKQRVKAKNKIGKLNGFYGKNHTVDTINKLRNVKLGKKMSNECKNLQSLQRQMGGNGRAVLIVNVHYGIFYDCIKEAAGSIGIPHSTLRARLNPKSGKTNRHPLAYV